MRQSTADQIVKAGQDLGLEIEAFPGYSGRGMYGKTTAGVVISGNDALGVFAAAVHRAAGDSADPGELLDDVAKVRTDALGLDTIFY